MIDGLIDLDDAERLARDVVDPATFAFIAAGAGAERALERNREAFAVRWLVPRVLAGLDAIDTGIELLGHSLSMPVLVAPMGMQALVHPDGECEMARGVRAAGTVMCVSSVASRAPDDIARAGAQVWFQLYVYRDPALNRSLLEQARAGGYSAIVLTVDGPVPGRRDRALRAGVRFPPGLTVPACAVAFDDPAGPDPATLAQLIAPDIGWETLERLIAEADMPVVVKGVLSAADAARACDLGTAAIIVSNHGGRQLDAAPAALDVLADVAEAVDGRAPVLVDGGVRHGTDVLIALALGADAVLVGRPALWGLALDGAAGVTAVLELLRDELARGLMLLGCGSPRAVNAEHLHAQREPDAARGL